MPLLLKHSRTKRPYSGARSAKGSVRYDRVLAPALQATGASTSTQKPGAYALALLDPEKSKSCVIPDLGSYPTSTYTLRESVTINTSAGGSGGIVIRLLATGAYALENITTTADAAYTYDANVNLSGQTIATATYRASRIVGASMRWEFLGNDSNNQGIGVISSYANTNIDASIPGTLPIQRNARNTLILPAKDGGMAIYKPADSSNFNFEALPTSTYQYGALALHFSGCAASLPIAIAHITVHYEAVALVSVGEFDDGSGATYVNGQEFSNTIAGIQGASPVTPGPTYTDGSYSKAAQQTAARIPMVGMAPYNRQMSRSRTYTPTPYAISRTPTRPARRNVKSNTYTGTARKLAYGAASSAGGYALKRFVNRYVARRRATGGVI